MVDVQVETGERRVGVLVIDDHPLFRDGICQLLSREPRLEVVAAVGSAAEAMEVALEKHVDLAIVDLVLPTGGGIGLTKRLKEAFPRCRVLGLSAFEDPVRIAAMIRAGADGFATKGQPPGEIMDAVRSVLGAARYLPPMSDTRQIEALTATQELSPLERLTHREREVYELLIDGKSNDEVAQQLSIARRTVETHRQHIMRKLDVGSVAELVHIAYRTGIGGGAREPGGRR